MKTRTFGELLSYDTFEERFEYLKLGGSVGRATFGFDRHLNQVFYGSREWRMVRRRVILRDNGCDLGVYGHDIHSAALVHHMNPVTPEDLHEKADWILDPEFLITTRHDTHNAIHYGDATLLPQVTVDRAPGDTRLW